MRIAAVTFHVLNVNDRTNWSFVRVELDVWAGRHRRGCRCNGYEPLLDACVRALAATLVGTEVEAGWRHLVTRPHAPGGLAQNAAKSAVAQALADAEARAAGVSLTQWLGGARRARVPVYANINRATVDRSPDGCARSAQAAVAAGWPAVKIAPFDGVFPDALDRAETRRAIDVGVARVAAIRAAVGGGAGVMVDCHWRFDEADRGRGARAAGAARPRLVRVPGARSSRRRIRSFPRLRGAPHARPAQHRGLRAAVVGRPASACSLRRHWPPRFSRATDAALSSRDPAGRPWG